MRNTAGDQSIAKQAPGRGPTTGNGVPSSSRAAPEKDLAAATAADEQTIRAWGAESQTEYVAIPPKTKKRDRDALTDHQREVRQRQRQGDCLQEEP